MFSEQFWIELIISLDKEALRSLKEAIELRWEHWRSGNKPFFTDRDLDSLFTVERMVLNYT